MKLARSIALLLLLGLWCGRAAAQAKAPYEYDPYRVRLWVAVEPSPAFSPALAAELARQLAARSEQAFGAAWNVSAKPCPPRRARQLAADPSRVTFDQLALRDKTLADIDKLIVIGIRSEAGECRVVAQELDGRSRLWGEAVVRASDQPHNVTEAAASALVAAFAPVVRIEQVEGQMARTRLRAGGLLLSDDSPATLPVGALLQPVLRRNDRKGQPAPNGIQRIPFTYLQVTEREGFKLSCAIHSGVRSPIGAYGTRTEKLALLIRPHDRGTRLLLRTRGTPPTELVDYEVLARPAGVKSEPQTVGFSDQRGAVTLPLTDQPIVSVYIRHGQQMLARVPIVPGHQAEQTLNLTDDDPRLAAEGFFLATQSTIMDLIARREVLAARIRVRLENKDFAGANKLLVELKNLAGRAELLRHVEQQRERFAVRDRAVQAKVDKMFAELRKLLMQHLDPQLSDQMAGEIKAAGGA